MSDNIRAKGVGSMLKSLQEDPSQDLLGQRFVSLCAELPDHDPDKVLALMEYANLISSIDPDRAIMIAYQIFQAHENYENNALEFMAKVFERKGKQLASQILRDEMNKLGELRALNARTQKVDPEEPQKPPKPIFADSKASALSDEKLYEKLVNEHIEANRLDDAEDLVLKLEAHYADRFWHQQAREKLKELLPEKRERVIPSVEVHLELSSPKLQPRNDFEAKMYELDEMIQRQEHRRSLLKLRRFVLFDGIADNASQEETRALCRRLEDILKELGFQVPTELLSGIDDVSKLKMFLLKRPQPSLTSYII